MMKRIVLCALFIISTTGCSRIVTQEPLFIDSNVSADVYSGDKKIGKTPFLATLKPEWTEHLSLRKKGYETQKIEIEKRPISYYSIYDRVRKNSNYYYEGNHFDTFTLILLSPLIIILMPLWLPELVRNPYDPATYAQSMYYVEMKPEK